MRTKPVLITTAAMLVAVGVIAAVAIRESRSDARTGSPTIHTRQDMAYAVVSVDGLVCSACVQRLHEELIRLPGVTKADVDLARRTASVTFDGRAKPSDDEIRAAVEAAGFRPVGVEWRQDLSSSPTLAQLVIHGTGGPACAERLQRTLDGRPGVRSVTVDFEKDVVTVVYDERHSAELMTTINKTGIYDRDARCGTVQD